MNETFDPLDQGAQPPKPKMPLGKVVLINFGIMVAYMLLTSLLMGSGHEAGLGVVVADAFLILIQFGINMLAGIVIVLTQNSHQHKEARRQLGAALLIGGILTAVIGFGSCLAHITIMES